MSRRVTRHINDIIASRRAFLGGLSALPLLTLTRGAEAQSVAGPTPSLGFASVAATNADTVSLPPGYRWRSLIAWGDALFDSVAPAFDPDALTRAEQEQRWGQNNDMLALFPARHTFPPETTQERMYLCANNEYFDPALMFPGLATPESLTAAHVETGFASCGISIVTLERNAEGWRVVKDARPGAGHNRRSTPFTPVMFSGPAARHAWITQAAAFVNAQTTSAAYEPRPEGAVLCGTLANCAGGQTPWGTYLSAEENFNSAFTASDVRADALRAANEDGAFVLDCANFGLPGTSPLGPLYPRQFDMAHNPYGPSLYGWIVEIDPHDPSWAPRKRTALGRRKAECATTALTRDGRVAVYSGDDQISEYVYKFVSLGRFDPAIRLANRDLLDEGQLYAAQFNEDGGGRWIALSVRAANAAARASGYTARFRDEADLMMRAREAARLLGATPMDRPEDIEAVLDERWTGQGPVLIVCTNNRDSGFESPGNPRRESRNPSRAQSNPAGHILRIDEADGDCGATRFTWNVFALGGDPNAADLVAAPRGGGAPAHICTRLDGAETISGDRFACPDNICIDWRNNVWIGTDGSDAVFADCNDSVLTTTLSGDGPRSMKRFLVGPVGGEICGPTMAPDERAFFASIQHPGETNAAGVDIFQLRWRDGQQPPSSFPGGAGAWPRSAVIVVTREDGGVIGD